MKFLLFTMGLICLYVAGYTQADIRGRVKDQQQYLPSVTVLLLNKDSVMIAGVTTDSIGNFLFLEAAPGTYIVTASMVGYAKTTSAAIVVDEETLITIPDITMQEVSMELEEVSVQSEKQQFEQKIDRLVINLQSSVTAAGNTMLEVLQKSPGVLVNMQNNTIALNGKSGVRIMINGKIVQAPMDVVVQMLQGMSASNVEKIELISTPPANYDAEGSGGIIHIVTKESLDLGTNGSVGLTLGKHWAESIGGSLNINHRNRNIAYFIDYSIVRSHNLHIMKMRRRFQNDFSRTIADSSWRENMTTQQNLSAGIEWRIGNRTAINLLITGYRRNWKLDAVAINTSSNGSDIANSTAMNVSETNIWQSATGSLGVQRKFNDQSQVALSFDYLFYHNNNPSQYNQQNNSEANIDLTKTTPISIFVGKLDYVKIISPSFTLESGVKAVTSTLDNNVMVKRLMGNEWMTDSMFTSSSTLSEHVLAGYLSTQWKPGRQWQLNAGLRYEHTETSIKSISHNDVLKRKYGYLFPTVSIKKILATEKELQFSYTRRMTRPTYNDIAPYVFFWGPDSFSAGNTSLYPATSDAITAGYHVRQWNVSIQYTNTKKEITMMQPEVDNASGRLIYKSQNLKYLTTLALSNSYLLNVTSWWEVQGSFILQFQRGETSHFPNNTSMGRYGVNINVVNVLKLPKNFSIEISGMYQSESLSGISRFLPFGSLNAGIQKTLGEKGTIRLSMDDILYTNNWRIETISLAHQLDVRFDYDWNNQFLRLTYTRNLGNTKLRQMKFKSGSEEERKRINN
jgi:hypothetical protein